MLDLGKNAFEGKGKELLSDEKVAELYLGGTAAACDRAEQDDARAD